MTLTIREKTGQRLGTLQQPLPLPVNLTVVEPPPQVLAVTLGYDGQAPTAVWAFEGQRRMEVSAVRRSSDPLANAVGVSVVDPRDHRLVGRLVCNDNGTGDTVVLPKGRYLLVASLGLLEEVSVELVVRIAPPKVPLVGRATGGDASVLTPPEQLLEGIGLGGDAGSQLLSQPLLEGIATGGSPSVLTYTAIEDITTRLVAAAAGVSTAVAAPSPFFWIDRRGRRMGPDVRITPFTYNQQIWRNADYRLLLRVTDSLGAPVDLSDLTVTVAVHDGRRFIRYATLTVDAARLADGIIDAELAWTLTAALPDQVWMDVLLENGSGQGQYPLEAIWIVEDGFTT